MKTAALVLAAGSSRRLGQPKQLLPYKGQTLLDASLDVARDAVFAQRMVTVGGAGTEVLETVDFDGFEVVQSVHYTQGCSSSIVSALDHIDTDVAGFVLLLGDQPEVDSQHIDTLLGAVQDGHQIAVCRYENGIGHPFWFGRDTFEDLAMLHGDKAVWKLIESGKFEVHKVELSGDIPLDVDTWEDYEQLLAANGDS